MIFAVLQMDHPPEEVGSELPFIFGFVMTLMYLLYVAFWVWMFIYCLKNDPDRMLWAMILLFFPFPGPLIYFIFRWLPSNQVRMPASVRRLGRGSEIARLEVATKQIGNAYQFVELGEALFEIGQIERAAGSFDHALRKEPENVQALWGGAKAAIRLREFDRARTMLTETLRLDPQYKFGDVSLALCKTLLELGEKEASREQFERHVSRWRHPEALFMLATLEFDLGNSAGARQHLQELLLDIDGAPKGIGRQHGMWKSRAHRLLRKLP